MLRVFFKINLIILILINCNCLFAQEEPLKEPTQPTKNIVELLAEDFFSIPKSDPITIYGKVIGVYDGDTATVLDSQKNQHKIRFNGIDAPEAKQEFGNRSKSNLSKMIFGKEVKVVSDKTDKYGRTVGNVYVDGIDVNLQQVRDGMAWHYKKYQDEQSETDRKLYAEAEIEARNAKRGIWSHPNPTPPWDWRRGESHPNTAGVPNGKIIGNKNSKIYHVPGCSTYAATKPENRVLFNTEIEAVEAGFRISSQCASSLPKITRPVGVYEIRKYEVGSRGGCYYVDSSGKKNYVDKSYCRNR